MGNLKKIVKKKIIRKKIVKRKVKRKIPIITSSTPVHPEGANKTSDVVLESKKTAAAEESNEVLNDDDDDPFADMKSDDDEDLSGENKDDFAAIVAKQNQKILSNPNTSNKIADEFEETDDESPEAQEKKRSKKGEFYRLLRLPDTNLSSLEIYDENEYVDLLKMYFERQIEKTFGSFVGDYSAVTNTNMSKLKIKLRVLANLFPIHKVKRGLSCGSLKQFLINNRRTFVLDNLQNEVSLNARNPKLNRMRWPYVKKYAEKTKEEREQFEREREKKRLEKKGKGKSHGRLAGLGNMMLKTVTFRS